MTTLLRSDDTPLKNNKNCDDTLDFDTSESAFCFFGENEANETRVLLFYILETNEVFMNTIEGTSAFTAWGLLALISLVGCDGTGKDLPDNDGDGFKACPDPDEVSQDEIDVYLGSGTVENDDTGDTGNTNVPTSSANDTVDADLFTQVINYASKIMLSEDTGDTAEIDTDDVIAYAAEFCDCDDDDPTINPDAIDVCWDGIDSDCGAPRACRFQSDEIVDLTDDISDIVIEGTTEDDYIGGYTGAADLNGDNLPDFAVTRVTDTDDGPAEVQIYTNDNNGSLNQQEEDIIIFSGPAGNEQLSAPFTYDFDDNGSINMIVCDPLNNGGICYITEGPFTESFTTNDSQMTGTFSYAEQSNEQFGLASFYLGDIDGNNIPNFAVTSPGYNYNIQNDLTDGRVWLCEWDSATEEVSCPAQIVTNSFQGDGVARGDINAYDFDGDNMSDFLVPASNADGTNGRLLYFAGRSSFFGDYNINTQADATFKGSTRSELGTQSGIGDFNGDGHADIVIAARLDEGVSLVRGAIYIFFGDGGGFSGEYDVEDADVKIVPSYNEDYSRNLGNRFGHFLRAADYDNDGIDDLLISSKGDSIDYFGFSCIIYGSA